MKILVAPSILAANFSILEDEIRKVETAGADMIHVDVMDGHFVPNITIGPAVVKDIRKVTKLPLDVHLMIEEPSKYVDAFAKAGSDIITVHAESEVKLGGIITKIKSLGIKAGVSVRPKTNINIINRYLRPLQKILWQAVCPIPFQEEYATISIFMAVLTR